MMYFLLLLYRNPNNYQNSNDPVIFNLCKNSTTAVEIKSVKDNKVIG